MSEANSHFIQLPDAGVQLSIINNLVLRLCSRRISGVGFFSKGRQPRLRGACSGADSGPAPQGGATAETPSTRRVWA